MRIDWIVPPLTVPDPGVHRHELGFRICSTCFAMVHTTFLAQHEDWHDWHQGTR
jgi:hypothetical protein